jgi:uncharacterized protein (TIGR02391 family)
MSLYEKIFPHIETVLELEPEELAIFVLRHLNEAGNQQLNRYNYTLGTSPDFRAWAGQDCEEVNERFMMAWMWLEHELFIAPKPGQSGDWAFITQRGKKILEDQNFETYQKGNLLSSEGLDPILVRKVKPTFIRGDYDTAVFQAFKEVEVRVRKKAGLNKNDFGVDLMRTAFKSPSGLLVDAKATGGEQSARMELFTGAIGSYKNPSSHRDVDFTDPKEAADIVHLANQLLRIVDSIELKSG